ncbi:hypothetical protein ABIA33_000885 [Streptacidiphilus sp. MAP12-16]|uniref:CBM35 domain-containing protein n=1 Tax=Streptacidiphilus sp. MAP12-16 TaxID=3156300 RepID=UPI0035114A33
MTFPPPVRERTVFHHWGVEISMSAENHGVPEDDDPFAYLYRGEGADGATGQETAPLPGVPRTSYHQATQVGRTQYGQQQPQSPPFAPQLPHQTTPLQQTAQYQAPPPGGGRAGARTNGGGRSSGGGRGVMIGTVAVAAAVAIGIGVALFNGGSPKTSTAGGANSAAASASNGSSASASASASPSASAALPGPADAATMQLVGNPTPTNNHTGAKAAGGTFVPLVTVGQGINWTVNVSTAGSYTFWVRYANAGGDSTATVVVNGTPTSYAIRLKNFSHESDWAKAWYRSYVTVNLKQGANTVGLTIGAGQGNVNIDQLGLSADKDHSPWS